MAKPANHNDAIAVRHTLCPAHGTVELGLYQTATREDWESYLVKEQVTDSAENVWRNADLVSQIQRTHHRKYPLCLFAQVIATHPEAAGWKSLVIAEDPSLMGDKEISRIDRFIEETIDDSECQLSSVFFPQLVSDEDLAHVIKAVLLNTQHITLTEIFDFGVYVGLPLRIQLNEATSQAESWLLGFGCTPSTPPSRTAPCVEVVIRTKTKPPRLHQTLNANPHEAHIADIPLNIPEKAFDYLLQETRSRTHGSISENRHLSKAKITFVLPQTLAHQFPYDISRK